jgi:hypothetical protein
VKKKKTPTPYSCNVLQVGGDFRQLWNFNIRGGGVHLAAHRKIAAPDPLPGKVVAKDWTTIFQRKLNVAWLPADQVFLRVIHLPTAEAQELLAMVELQLEKLSPLPVNQIVWSAEWLPARTENLRTAIIVIVARSLVEEFLGKMEGSGYLVDRLEVPCLHQVLDSPFQEDAVWVYPAVPAGENLCLVAWWFDGTLQQLQLIHLPEGENRTNLVIEQLTKTAWAGEVEGWLKLPARCHVVADAATAAAWDSALCQWSGQPVVIDEPIPEGKLGELAARRASFSETTTNLVPPEYGTRYQQQLVDRLWMTGLGSLLGVYIVGVLIYLGALWVLNFQYRGVQSQITALSGSYTNAVKLKEETEVLQEQLHLKYAALDCFKAVAERLPTEFVLISFEFQRGQKVVLQGTAPAEETSKITDYYHDLRRAQVDGQALFKQVSGPSWVNRAAGGVQTVAWNFTCELNRTETE